MAAEDPECIADVLHEIAAIARNREDANHQYFFEHDELDALDRAARLLRRSLAPEAVWERAMRAALEVEDTKEYLRRWLDGKVALFPPEDDAAPVEQQEPEIRGRPASWWVNALVDMQGHRDAWRRFALSGGEQPAEYLENDLRSLAPVASQEPPDTRTLDEDDDQNAACMCEWLHPSSGEIDPTWPAVLDPGCAVHGDPNGFPQPPSKGRTLDELCKQDNELGAAARAIGTCLTEVNTTGVWLSIPRARALADHLSRRGPVSEDVERVEVFVRPADLAYFLDAKAHARSASTVIDTYMQYTDDRPITLLIPRSPETSDGE
jgi:hypothetical protein